MSNKVDSNFTGLRYAMEVTGQPGVLPGEGGNTGQPNWLELEPNSYSDFGSDLKSVARSPITVGRQKKKGRIVDLDAKAGFQLDFTGNNMVGPLTTFMFAAWRKSKLAVNITGVNGGTETYNRAGGFGTGWVVGGLALAEKFDTPANNGLKRITATTADTLVVAENLTTEAGADADTLAGWTITITIDADVDNGYVTDRVVSYTFDVGDTVDDAGAALLASFAALVPAVTATYTGGTDVLQIASAENSGESVITAVVTDSYGLVQTVGPTIEAPTGTVADTRDIDLTPLAAPNIVADAAIRLVGFQSAAGDIDVDASDPALPAFTSTALDFTTLPLLAGKWIYVGGDTSIMRFTSAGNNGYARVHSVAANRLVFDKTQNTMATEANTTKTVQFFFGDLIKNEDDPDLIITQSIQLERKLSNEGFEYAVGCFGNELTVNLPTADKITVDLGFLALDTEPLDDRKTGLFPVLITDSGAFNTSSDMIRLRASEQGSASPLFGFVQDMTLKIANNITTLKALGVLGAFDVTIGDFEVTGDMTAYFNDLEAVQAIRNSTSLTLDFVLAFDNRGWIFDIPLFTGDKGTLAVEKDKAITIPVGVNAAEDEDLNTTLIINWFPYLPSVATPQV